MNSLEGKCALVTGASAGIGAASARSLAAAGAAVVLAARRRERLEQLRDEIQLAGGRAEVCVLDVCDGQAVDALLGKRPQPFDLVLLNAGLALGTETLAEGDPAEWSTVIDTNIKGVLGVLRATLPAMLAADRGDVVFLGSVAGRQVYPGGNVYCASKHAVRAIYEACREEHAGAGVRFTTVDPGMVQTDFSSVRFRGDEQAAAEVYANVEPMTPEDVADAILWAVTRPARVNIGEIVLWARAQATTRRIMRRPS
ncbi:MAG: SDR family NAD(P)-dependent oxidoreductase [Planctomycetota bacterium]|jgi:NADP-dependent 3-hydroxy acid dehydrogenase YdfG|nr:NAD(P)-dependent oxidoreductase [Planctomycetota bacterium]MDP6370861.1 SDR family NAD(P)-dependent oxidoreductase [Planctomycetota bacterium]MDP6838028.1 SDR family NAD(P)-dependent oxidoreductase [Planctomycetota bacterium]